MSRRWSARISDGNSSTTPLAAAGTLAPTFLSFSSLAGAVSPFAITKPADVAQNTVMVASIALTDAGQVVTPPAGWTLIRQDVQSDGINDDVNVSLYWKRAGAAEPANYTWTFSGGLQSAKGFIGAYNDVVTSGDPVNTHSGAIETPILAGDTTVTAPSALAATAGSMLIGFFAHTNQAPSFTPPPGMTERHDQSGGNFRSSVADQIFGAGGDTGARTATLTPAGTATQTNVGQLVALTPAVAGGGDTFFGSAEDALDYSGLRVAAESDQFGLIQVQFSQDGANWRTTDEFAMINGRFDPVGETFRSEIIPVHQRFVRINLENEGGVAQTFLRLQTTLLPEADQPLNRTPERYVVYQAINVLVEPATVTTILTVSGDDATRALEMMAYGAVPQNQTTTTSGFAYNMRLVWGAQTNHSHFVRNNVGSWQPVRFETRGRDLLVQVRHDEALAQRFDAFLEVREP